MEREKAKRNQQLLVQSWQTYKAQHASKLTGPGLTGALPDGVFVRRANVVEAFLKAGIPLAKADQLRPLMEEGSQRLTFSTHSISDKQREEQIQERGAECISSDRSV